MAETTVMEKLVSLCKRRGFIYPGSEIYGGLQGTWDYGPLGVELLRNIKNAWWHDNVTTREDVVGLDAAILMHRKVWQASGHEVAFTDPLVDCKACKARFRADQIAESACPRKPSKHPGEFAECQLTEPRKFNLMFKTFVGPVEEDADQVYLRPETAQGIFVNFKNVVDSTRIKVPFGIGQVGKSFRNEITPKQFIFRSREFEQMEIEFFCHPSESLAWYQYWRDRRYKWYLDLGLAGDRLRLRDHTPDELSHYSVGTADIEYAFPFLAPGEFGELEGVAHRGDFDLRSHMEGKLVHEDPSDNKSPLVVEKNGEGKPRHRGSGKDMNYFDDQTKQRFIPHVIEPSAGADRATLAFLCQAYTEDEVPDESGKATKRVSLKLHPRLAPVKAAVFPLVKKDGMPEVAKEIYSALKPLMNVFYDEKGAVGRRYRRQDEIGTPFCVTVDGDTLKDGTVTIRDRDSLKQWRVKKDEVVSELCERLQ